MTSFSLRCLDFAQFWGWWKRSWWMFEKWRRHDHDTFLVLCQQRQNEVKRRTVTSKWYRTKVEQHERSLSVNFHKWKKKIPTNTGKQILKLQERIFPGAGGVTSGIIVPLSCCVPFPLHPQTSPFDLNHLHLGLPCPHPCLPTQLDTRAPHPSILTQLWRVAKFMECSWLSGGAKGGEAGQ